MLTPILLSLSAAASPCPQEAAAPEAASKAGARTVADDIAAALAETFGETDLPGGAAAIVRRGEPIALGSFGVRKAGDDTPFLVDDPVHVGSNTKAMNAVLVGRLVDRGLLTFETTIAEALPELAKEIHADYHDVTVLQLLRHSSGAPANAKNWFAFGSEDLAQRRRRIVATNLSDPPQSEPGTKFLYSNLGSMVASVMCEEVAEASWEDLMQREVFGPLGMASAGFGAPGTSGEVDAPWGHTKRGAEDAPFEPIQGDNDLAMAGAAIAHMPLADHGAFVLALSDEANDGSFLKRETRDALLERGPFGYAGGWAQWQRPWSKGPVYSHAGSNTMWYESVWMAPKEGVAYLVAVNGYDASVPGLVDAMVGRLLVIDRRRNPAPR